MTVTITLAERKDCYTESVLKISGHRHSSSCATKTTTLTAIAAAFRSSYQTVHIWFERTAQRRQLKTLSDHLLNDIGISRSAADSEAQKRFWQE